MDIDIYFIYIIIKIAKLNKVRGERWMSVIEKILKGPEIKILTVTLNPVLDRTLYISNFQIGKTLIAENVKNYAGGKGVNVSRALKTMQANTLATGLIPETGSGFYLSILDYENIPHKFLKVSGTLRINTTIISNVLDSETHIRERGCVLSREDMNRFLGMLEKIIPEFHGVALSGSIPIGIDESIYRKIIQLTGVNGPRTYLDAWGNPLKEGIKARPLLVKPNLREAEELTGIKVKSRDDLISIIKKIHQSGIRYIALSLGKDGLIFSSGEKCFQGKCTVERIINTVGSGDASLAGAILGIEKNLSEWETTSLSVSMGTANTQSDGACHFKLDELRAILEKVEIYEIPI